MDDIKKVSNREPLKRGSLFSLWRRKWDRPVFLNCRGFRLFLNTVLQLESFHLKFPHPHLKGKQKQAQVDIFFKSSILEVQEQLKVFSITEVRRNTKYNYYFSYFSQYYRGKFFSFSLGRFLNKILRDIWHRIFSYSTSFLNYPASTAVY